MVFDVLFGSPIELMLIKPHLVMFPIFHRAIRISYLLEVNDISITVKNADQVFVHVNFSNSCVAPLHSDALDKHTAEQVQRKFAELVNCALVANSPGWKDVENIRKYVKDRSFD